MLPLHLLLMSGAGCDRAPAPAAALPQRTEFAVQFDSTVGADSTGLRSALIAFGDSLHLTHFQASISQFGGAPTRYFAFLIGPPAYKSGNVQFALLTARDGAFAVKDLFDTGVPSGPVGIALEALADFDSDGLPDAHYCDFSLASDSTPVSRVLGYGGAGWYAVQTSKAVRCRADTSR